jgi:glycerol-3-phosphate cytidylyltransferase-like family protein
MTAVYVSGSFDDLRSRQVRFLEEAARFGPVQVLLWSDSLAQKLDGKAPKFPQVERQYFLEAIRFVDHVILIDILESQDRLPAAMVTPNSAWVVNAEADSSAKADFCRSAGITYHIIPDEQLRLIPGLQMGSLAPTGGPPSVSERKKVIVTGCYDWLHTGHVRFF